MPSKGIVKLRKILRIALSPIINIDYNGKKWDEVLNERDDLKKQGKQTEKAENKPANNKANYSSFKSEKKENPNQSKEEDEIKVKQYGLFNFGGTKGNQFGVINIPDKEDKSK